MERQPSQPGSKYELDCTSEAWLKGHADGLAGITNGYPYPEGPDLFNYKDGWLTGYCERPLERGDK